MLIKCPECELQVSDKALSCPHCGYPMTSTKARKYQKPAKHKRLPNGFGQITELKNPNLRNRFRAMVSVGKTPEGRPISKLLKPQAYFPTYNDAYAALLEYNKNPYDLDASLTVKELYDRWSVGYYETASDGGARSYKAAWKYCSSIYSMRIADVRPRHIKGCMEEGVVEYRGVVKHASAGVKSRIKSLFNLLMDYAVEYDLVDKNYARAFNVSDDVLQEIEDNKKSHLIFTQDEMNTLWKHENDVPFVDIILFQCFSGFRPQELGLLVLTNVNLDEGIIIGGMKTAAGRLRTVPIHESVRHIVESKYQEALDRKSPYLFNCFDERVRNGYKLTYSRYRQRFLEAMECLGLNEEHKPHDPRKHFITLAKKYQMDEYALKYIVGHEIEDITEKVYTERENQWLIDEMAKIKNV